MSAVTIILIEDTEKDPALLEHFRFGLKGLNPEALARIQIRAVSQRAESPELECLRDLLASECDIEVAYAADARAADGYPLWDVCAEVRSVWPRVTGEYVTFAHTEYLFGPGRLVRTLEWLAAHQPALALGNLRRLDAGPQFKRERAAVPKTGPGEMLRLLLDAREIPWLSKLWDHFPTGHWPYWQAALRANNRWEEDIFFARRDWLETLHLFEHGGALPFQDIYDLVGAVMERLTREQLAPACPRLPRAVHEAIHLNHPRGRTAFGLPCYKWFLDHEAEWRKTAYLRHDLWAVMLADKKDEAARRRAVDQFRRGPGGTVSRFAAAFGKWLDAGGCQAVREYQSRRAQGAGKGAA